MKILNICKLFFEQLNSNHIRYCHWKSNSHLDKALNGETDLDILIHPDDKEKFEQSCIIFNIKEVLSTPDKQFPGLADYLGFDHETGRLIHLHVHYRLILGQRYIKNHHLPIEAVFFSHLTTKYNIPIPTPELELIILIIRAHMKLEYLSLLKKMVRDIQRRNYCLFPKDIEEELSQLIVKCNTEKFKSTLTSTNLPLPLSLFTDFVSKFTRDNLCCFDSLQTKRNILDALKNYRRKNAVTIHLHYFLLFLRNSRLRTPFFIPNKKTVLGMGKIFSLVGADGSGKSTLIVDLEKWLSWKLSIKRYYYGIPKSNVIKFVQFMIYILKKLHLLFLSTCCENVFWVFIAKTRYKVFLSSKSDISQGHIVLTDRFPLNQFQNMKQPMDGPRLNLNTNKTGDFFPFMENYYYSKIVDPDCTIVLQVDIDELRRRKTDLDIGVHKLKADAVNAIEIGRNTVLIDAGKPYQDVLLDIKKFIWAFL